MAHFFGQVERKVVIHMLCFLGFRETKVTSRAEKGVYRLLQGCWRTLAWCWRVYCVIVGLLLRRLGGIGWWSRLR